jgi:hypothetical protein
MIDCLELDKKKVPIRAHLAKSIDEVWHDQASLIYP